MRVITLNVNGIRSAARKGLLEWLPAQEADLVCLQEIRAQDEHLVEIASRLPGFHCHFHPAERKGYSGVALLSREPPRAVSHGIGWPDLDAEGRWLEARFGNLSVVSVYLPSGTSGDPRQALKMDFLDRLLPHLRGLRRKRRQFLFCGDFNIAHKTIDLKNWRGNQKNSGFLPEERAWMDRLFGEVGMVDAFRLVDPRPERYTWWSNRGQAWAKNVGWRIDYQVATPTLGALARCVDIYTAQRFSDHAPLTIDYDFTLAAG